MDKRQLQTFSVWAKENLEQQIEVSLKSLGINSASDIKAARRAGEVTVIDGDPNSYPADLLGKRDSIIQQVQAKGYRHIIEEFAYTWFNRLVALRFMEVHNYLPHGFRVLSSTTGSMEPDILRNLPLVKDDLKLNMELCGWLKEQGKTEELFRYVLLQQCTALSGILPMLFEHNSSYMELLLPKALLIGDTVLTRLMAIPEGNFLNDVEIIGWMYQFYISAKKDEVNDSKKTITKETLPAVTQLFTPDWIVRYMAENSVGRIWLESYPQSSLRSKMKYYVEEAEQTEEVKKKLDEIRYRNVNPESIRVVEPCCGSGHIAVYVFDLLYQMYEEKGYNRRDIPTLILKNNLVCMDVDKRAAQLASFALVMKARSINPRFFSSTYYTLPQVLELLDSQLLISLEYRKRMEELKVFSKPEINEVGRLVSTFTEGKIIGSLIKVPELNYALLRDICDRLEKQITTTFNVEFLTYGIELLRKLISQAEMLAASYDVMITNPPYLGTSKMEKVTKDYAASHYPNSKTDMFAMFMETEFVKSNGFLAMINMHGWMFITSYEKLREKLLRSQCIVTMAHLAARAFDTISGEVVQTTSFVIRNNRMNGYSGNYYDLTEPTTQLGKEELFHSGKDRYVAQQDSFFKIPGSPIVYTLSPKFYLTISDPTVSSISDSRCGMNTGDNDSFIRYWFEINSLMFEPSAHTTYDFHHTGRRYAVYNKGGSYRKWYGNLEYVIKFNTDDFEVLLKQGNHLPSRQFYFRECITWTDMSTHGVAFRYQPFGSVFDGCAATAFPDKEQDLYYILALLNSAYVAKLAPLVNPTLHFKLNDYAKIPYKDCNEAREVINCKVAECISLSRADWNSFETSWDFQRHPLIEYMQVVERESASIAITPHGEEMTPMVELCIPLGTAYQEWERVARERFEQLKANEEELNRIFIDIYGLQDELKPEVADENVTVRLADKQQDIRSLISYLVGVVMGRYSLDVPGLAYAGGNWDASKYVTYQPDDDGIVPIYRGIGMDDGLTARLIKLIKHIYGEESYRENMEFIADALGKKTNESAEETLNRYLNDGFFADHLKVYQKRPIYWLFTSGKNGGFKCLIYMHRYNQDTLARINGKYFLPESTRLKHDLEDIEQRVSVAEGSERVRLEKERQRLMACYQEALAYGQVLDHMANKYIAIDLDDGVKVNYAKFQGVEMVTDGGSKVKMDLLAPLK